MSALAADLKAIGLTHTAQVVNDLIAEATQKRLAPAQLLERIVRAELAERTRRGFERRFTRSRIGRFKPVADFDWAWPKRIDKDAVEAALTLEFITAARNVVLVAPQGLGKTMLAKNIAHAALTAGYSVLFVSASQMLLDLAAQDSARSLERRIRHYGRPALLCIDEVGYLSYDTRNADLPFQIISRHYELKSIVLTTNLAFSDWPTVFPNATSATALIDRTIHHADIIAIEGDSYRRREAQLDKKAKKRA